jgi:HEAT repeat protein
MLKRCLAVVLLTGLGWTNPVAAQTNQADPVEELRQVLKGSLYDPAERDLKIKGQIKSLQGIGDMRRALGLREWRDLETEGEVPTVDRRNRTALIERFEQAVRDVLRQGDDTIRLAVLSILNDTGCSTRGMGNRTVLAAAFAPDLVNLIKQGAPPVREAACRTLGLINPDVRVAIPALGGMLHAKQVSERAAAADALVNLMECVTHLATASPAPNTVQAGRADVVQMGRAIMPLAGQGLRDTQPEVRRRCVEAIAQAADALHKLVGNPQSAESLEGLEHPLRPPDEERGELLPLIAALKDQVPALTRSLADPDTQVRLLARRALEDMTNPQLRLLARTTNTSRDAGKQPAGVLQPSRFVPGSSSAKDPLVEGLQGTVSALAQGLHDQDVRARRAAIDVLETLGPAAAPAASALVDALSDGDRFVRWAAARTLGKISPVEADAAVPALAQLLDDPDLDLRLAAMTALERYGSSARLVLPDLVRAVGSTDADLRIAAIHVLEVIGSPHTATAIPTLADALADGNPRVRREAAVALGKIGVSARSAAEPLRKALQDDDPDVQKAAGEALLKIMRTVKK